MSTAAVAPEKDPLGVPLYEKIAIGVALFLALMVLLLSTSSQRIRYWIFGTYDASLMSEPIALVSSFTGRCERKPSENFVYDAVTPNQSLYIDDTIVSGPQSECVFVLKPDLEIRMGPDSLLKLTREMALASFDFSQLSGGDGKIKIKKTQEDWSTKFKAVATVPKVVAPPKPIETFSVTKAPPVPVQVAPSATPSPSVLPFVKSNIQWLVPPKAGSVKPTAAQARAGKVVTQIRFKLEKALPGSMLEIVADTGANAKGVLQPIQSAADGSATVPVAFAKPGYYVTRVLDSQKRVVGENRITVQAAAENALKLLDPTWIPQIRLHWEQVPAKHYKVRITTAQGAPVTSTQVTEPSVLFPEFDPLSQYDYKIAAVLRSGFELESPTQRVKFKIPPPVVREPKEGEVVTLEKGKKSLVTWNTTDRTKSYLLEIASDPKFQMVMFAKTVLINFSELYVIQPGNYYARVSSNTAYGKAIIGPVRNFKVKVKSR
ncbi:MAG: hypothetical protein JNL01_09715 [Bdellovibrionales bacterium]|nr:hypothetical protein [Bdellovibrionales bacterium]